MAAPFPQTNSINFGGRPRGRSGTPQERVNPNIPTMAVKATVGATELAAAAAAAMTVLAMTVLVAVAVLAMAMAVAGTRGASLNLAITQRTSRSRRATLT